MENKEVQKVKRIAHKLYRHYFPEGGPGSVTTVHDFIGYGIIGLLKAKQDYQPSKGTFLTYAEFRIKGEIIDQMRGKFKLVSESIHQRKQAKQLTEAKAALEADGRTVNLEALSEMLEWDTDKILRVEAMMTCIHSIDLPEGAPELPDHNRDAEDEFLDKELPRIIKNCIEMIPDKQERLAFELRYKSNQTLAQIAAVLDRSIETARSRAEAGKKYMQTCLGKNGWNLLPGTRRT